MLHEHISSVFPILNSEELNKDVARAVSGDTSVDHLDSGCVITVEGCGVGLRETKFDEDGTEVLGMFGCADGSVELGFSRAGGSERLGFAFIGDGATCEKEGVASGGTTLAEVVGMGSVDETSNGDARFKGGKWG
jgi:hypothetical protein